VLARSLRASNTEQPVMGQLQSSQRIYKVLGPGDVLAKLREDIDWEHDAVGHGIPWLVPGRGKAHVLSFFGVIGCEFDMSRFELASLLKVGTQLVAVIHIEATIAATGKQLRDLELHLSSADASGQVAKFRHVVETHRHWLVSRA
jgi:hypothetical protein